MSAECSLRSSNPTTTQTRPKYHLRLHGLQKRKTAFWDGDGDSWVLEISCIIVATAALITLIVILRRYDLKALGEWPWIISPNAFLAVFSTIVKTFGLLPVAGCIGQLKWTWFAKGKPKPLSDLETFDSASRGILGSITLLWKLKFRHTASLGAFITIIAIAVDPVTQQAISTRQRSVMAPSGVANVVRAEDYSIPAAGLTNEDDDLKAPDEIVGSLYIGLYTPLGQNVSYPEPTCSTGNCTFSPYTTLGVCTETREISAEARKKACPTNCFEQGKCHPLCQTLGTSMMDMEPLRGPILTHWPAMAYPTTNVTQSIAFPELTWPLLIVDMTYRNNYSEVAVDKSMRSFETAFYYCVQQFETSQVNGKTETRMVKSATNTQIQSMDWGSPFPQQLLLRPDDKPDAPPITVDPDASYTTSVSMYKLFFNGSAVNFGGGEVRYLSEPGRVFASIMEQGGPEGSPRAPNRYELIPQMHNNIAVSLSTAMKEHPGNGTQPIFHTGTATHMELYILVNWPWLSLTFAIIPLSVVLLTITIIRGMQKDTRVWKTSSLPILQALSPEAKRELGNMERLSRSEARSGEVRVLLRRDGETWSLGR